MLVWYLQDSKKAVNLAPLPFFIVTNLDNEFDDISDNAKSSQNQEWEKKAWIRLDSDKKRKNMLECNGKTKTERKRFQYKINLISILSERL